MSNNNRKTEGYTHEALRDILITALEGGIGYWACFDNTHVAFRATRKLFPDKIPISKVAFAVLEDNDPLYFFDTESGEEFEPLTMEGLVKGTNAFLNIMIHKGVEPFSKGMEFSEAVEKLNSEEYILDAEDADIVIQYALFGEVVYG